MKTAQGDCLLTSMQAEDIIKLDHRTRKLTEDGWTSPIWVQELLKLIDEPTEPIPLEN